MLKNKSEKKKQIKARIRKRIRSKIRGTADRPRVYVFKSNRHLYAQAINDDLSAVVASASTLEKEFRETLKNSKNKEASENLGRVLARRLKEKKIDRIVFDRGTYPYHGRVKILAESLRKGGLAF